jgi:hypothetical protein
VSVHASFLYIISYAHRQLAWTMQSSSPLRHAQHLVAPTADEAKAIDSIQGRVVTMEGVPMYFKPRLDILTRIDEAGVTARLRVP